MLNLTRRTNLLRLRAAYVIVALLAIAAIDIPNARANDGMFPPSPEAKAVIDFDGKGFIIDGKRTFIASAGMEYARVPRALWRDRLLRIKRAGMNTVEIYIFWNFHEPQEGKWDFSGDHDLNAFLQLVHEAGLYATVRVGPYVCAEWDSGGYPIWLRFKPGLTIRNDSPGWLAECDEYFEHVIPIVAANQINHGGAVILVQIENEYSGGWGTDSNAYTQHLRAKALSLGIQVPTFFSGQHHSSDPAGNTPWNSIDRTNPWTSTEFWTTWYDVYGSIDPNRLANYDRATWKIIAFGGNGYNYYMFHGGSNFGYTNDDEDAASYDYGAAIGQAGDLRPMYYHFRRAAMFARTFQDILENSVNSATNFAGAATDNSLRVIGRTSPAGSIVFLDNQGKSAVQTQVKDAFGTLHPDVPITIPGGVIFPVIENFALDPAFTIDQAVTRVLTTLKNGADTTLIVYGAAGERGSIALSSQAAITGVSGDGVMQSDADHVSINFTYPADALASYVLKSGSERLRILVLNDDEADHTWPVSVGGVNEIVSGPDFVGDVNSKPSGLSVQAEFRGAVPGTITVDGPGFATETLRTAQSPAAMPNPPTLTGWQQRVVSEQSPGFDDQAWLASDNPQPMGADGDTTAYAWYRSSFTAASSGTNYLIPGTIRDRMIVFVDGNRIDDADVTKKSATLTVTAGKHCVAILAAHYGRSKLFGYSGPFDAIDAKGLTGPCALSSSPVISLSDWKSMPMTTAKPDVTQIPAIDAPGWTATKLGTDVFRKTPGWAWFETIIPASASVAASPSIHFDSVDDNATVFCNGQQVGSHEGWNDEFDISLGAAFHAGQPNVVAVLDENKDGAGGISGTVTLGSTGGDSVLTGWRMRGGIGDPASTAGYGAVTALATAGLPSFFQAHFTTTLPTTGAYPILRVHLGGMSKGFVWLNGHNLGRYPERIPVDGLYLPECWLNAGDNSLVVFDEDGLNPSGVKLVVEQAASRFTAVYGK